jgi:hypothetical protein
LDDAITLSTLAGGSLEERFQLALAEVLDNLLDPNTPKKARRSITIKISIANLSDDRRVAGLRAEVGSKLASTKPVDTFAILDLDEDRVVAHEVRPRGDADPRQLGLAGVTPITPIRKEPR